MAEDASLAAKRVSTENVFTVQREEVKDWRAVSGFKVIKWRVKQSPTDTHVHRRGIPEKGQQTVDAVRVWPG